MRYFLSICAGLIIAAGTVHAQVAAPSLAPLQFGSFTANPATIQWSGSSYVGAAVLSGDRSGTDDTGVTDPDLTGELDGTLLQARAVGDMFSFAVEILDIEIKDGDSVDGEALDASGLNVGIAAFITESISVGVGMENLDLDSATTAAGVQSTEATEISTTVLGLTARLTDTIFLGAALGNEDATVTANGSSVDFDRGITRVGVAMLSISSGFMAHLEAYLENRDAFEFDTGSGVLTFDERETTALVAEVIWNNILIGVHLTDTNSTDTDVTGATDFDEDTSESVVLLGWVPEEGLALVASMSTEDIDDNLGTGASEKEEVLSVGIALVF